MKKSVLQALLQYSFDGIIKRFPGVDNTGLETHLNSTINWLLYAQSMNPDGGLSANYNILKCQWAPSYPEITGYTIPTLLRYAKRYSRDDIHNVVLKMTEYELRIQLSEGGIPCTIGREGNQLRPIAFDTGQVLFGLLETNEEFNDNRYLDAAVRAGDWLVASQAKDGSWQDYHLNDSSLTIDARVAWPLILLYKRVGKRNYLETSYRQLEWVLGQQNPNGWYQNCSFTPNNSPITHTLAYTIEGLLESGLLLGETQMVIAARKAADAILEEIKPSGYLPGAFDEEWRPTVSWNCLTGSAQMAIIWLRLAKLTGLPKYKYIADQTIKFIASTQYLNGFTHDLLGGIAGSWPIFGRYMYYKFPSWSAKFFADAIMALQDEI
jgi:hypothetical protein